MRTNLNGTGISHGKITEKTQKQQRLGIQTEIQLIFTDWLMKWDSQLDSQ
jgi:hypothetical protein